MPFTEDQITQIRHLINYSIEELKPKSFLRDRIGYVQQFDIDNNTNIVGKIQGWLTEIEELEEAIAAYETDSADGQYKRVELDGEYNVEFFEQKQSAPELRQKRNNLIACIVRDLGLNINSRIKRVVKY